MMGMIEGFCRCVSIEVHGRVGHLSGRFAAAHTERRIDDENHFTRRHVRGGYYYFLWGEKVNLTSA